MLRWPLPYSNMSWPQAYMCLCPPEPFFHLPPHPSSRLSQSSAFGFPVSYIKNNSIHLLFYNPVCWKSNASLPRLKPRCARRCGSFCGQGEALFLSFPAPRWYPLSFSHNSLPLNFKSAMLHLSDHFFIATSPSGWSQL